MNDHVLVTRKAYRAQEEWVYMVEQEEWWCADRQARLNYLHDAKHFYLLV